MVRFERRAPLLAPGTYRIERRVVYTSEGIKTVITLDTLVCRQCQTASHPDIRPLHGHPQRWRYTSALADKCTEIELVAVLSADVAHFLRGEDTGDVP